MATVGISTTPDQRDALLEALRTLELADVELVDNADGGVKLKIEGDETAVNNRLVEVVRALRERGFDGGLQTGVLF